MIVRIEGKLIEAAPLSAIVDVQGIGYEIHIPVTTAEKLPGTGATVLLHTLAVYREDTQALYGFSTREERDFFRLLTEKVSGIGPKIGLSIMSKLSLPMLKSAIAQADVGLLAKCPGIGRKTAERLCVELGDKIGALAPVSLEPHESGSLAVEDAKSDPTMIQDAVRALMTLGYKTDVADKAVRKAAKELGDGATTEDLIRTALK